MMFMPEIRRKKNEKKNEKKKIIKN